MDTGRHRSVLYLSAAERSQFSDSTSLISTLNARVDSAQSLFDSFRGSHLNSVRHTPLERASWLSTAATAAFVKLESEQVTGSFKARGALHFCHRAAGAGFTRVVTASTGNHALGVVNALSICGMSGTIFLPNNAAETKVTALRAAIAAAQADIDLRFHGDDCADTELAALRYSQDMARDGDGQSDRKEDQEGRQEQGEEGEEGVGDNGVGTKQSDSETKKVGEKAIYASPYNDMDVMGGNGTIANDILTDVCKIIPTSDRASAVCALYATVGGGGMISGIAARLKSSNIVGEWRVVGCLPERSAAMYECARHGGVTAVACGDTLSDGSAGGIEPGAQTVPLCAALVDAYALVSEAEIAAAMARVFRVQRRVIEGAAGVAVAGFGHDEAWRNEQKCRVAVVVACGGNIEADAFVRVVQEAGGGGNGTGDG